MSNKVEKIVRYVVYAVLTNIVYGFTLYFLVTWLARYSLLYAYLGNLAMVALGLAGDLFLLKGLTSQKYVEQLKTEATGEKEYQAMQWLLQNYVSFKAMLYLFYALLLFVSQVINFSDVAVSEDLGNFMRTTDYSILIIIAFDEFGERFTQGTRRAEVELNNLKRRWAASRP